MHNEAVRLENDSKKLLMAADFLDKKKPEISSELMHHVLVGAGAQNQ